MTATATFTNAGTREVLKFNYSEIIAICENADFKIVFFYGYEL